MHHYPHPLSIPGKDPDTGKGIFLSINYSIRKILHKNILQLCINLLKSLMRDMRGVIYENPELRDKKDTLFSFLFPHAKDCAKDSNAEYNPESRGG
jgi:hypothetical protein